MTPAFRAMASILLVIALQLVALFTISGSYFDALDRTNYFPLLAGGFLGQFALLAAWLALWDAPWRLRLATFAILGLVALNTTAISLLILGNTFDLEHVLFVAGFYCVLIGVFWLPRLTGWRLVSAAPPPAQSATGPGLAIIVWLVVIVLGLSAIFLLMLQFEGAPRYYRYRLVNDVAESFISASFAMLVTLPSVFGLVSVLYRGKWRWHWRGTLAVLVAGMGLTFLVAFAAQIPLGTLFLAIGFLLTQLAATLLLAFVLTLGGWQLKRAGENLFAGAEAPAPAASDDPSPGTLALYQDSFRRHLPLWLLIIAHCLYAGFIGFAIDRLFRDENIFVFIMLGILAAQPALGAIWLALYQAPLRSRLPAMAGVAVASATCFLLGVGGEIHEKLPVIIALFFFLGLVLLLVLGSIPYLIWRAIARKVIVGPPSCWPSVSARGQFSLADLMLWTAGCAIVFGLARWTLSFEIPYWYGRGWYYILSDLPEGMFVIGMMVLASLPELLMILAVLHENRRGVWLGVGLGLELVYFVVIMLLAGGNDPYFFEGMLYLLTVKFAATATVAGTLGILLANGYRVQSVPRKLAAPELAPAPKPQPATMFTAASETTPEVSPVPEPVQPPEPPPGSEPS